MVKVIVILMIWLCASISEAQVTQGTVFSKTEDGNGNKITSTVSGPSRGLDTNCLNCGGGGPTYLDADGIADQTTSAMHGQMYMYNGATWDRVRGSIAGGLQVNCITGCAGGASTPTDAFANPTTAGLQMGFLMGWNGATWDRLRSSIANGLVVDVSRVQGTVAATQSGAWSTGRTWTLSSGTDSVTVGNSFLLDATFTGRFAAAYLDADTIANQTTTAMHGQLYGYNGATWDRLRSSIANGLAVDVTRITGNVTVVQGTGTNLHIVCDSGCGGAATFADNSAFTFGTTAVNNMGAVVDDTATNTVTENSAGAPRMNTNRILYGMPTNSSGTALYPSAAVEADAIANPTLTQIGTFMHGYNGATWDRLRSTTANGLAVDVTRVTGNVAVTNAGLTNLDVALSTRLAESTFTGRFAAAYLDADAIANQTTTAMHGQLYGYNGVTWDRLRATTANGLAVDVTRVTGNVAVTNAGLTNLDVALSTRLAESTFTGRFTAATLDADAIANETTTAIHGKCYLYNGTTWDRCRGAVATGLLVNISNATLAVTQSGTWNIGTLTSITNTVTVQGAKTNNNAAPGATNVGTLPCIATAAAPSNTEGNQVGCSQNLLGATRTIEQNFVTTANNDGACPSGAASFTALASNASRTWAAVWASPANTDDVYIKLGATATTADARFAPGQALNFTSGRIYTGVIDAIPASGTQAVCVMELN